MKHLSLTILLISGVTFSGTAQEEIEEWTLYKPSNDSVAAATSTMPTETFVGDSSDHFDPAKQLSFETRQGRSIEQKDERITEIIEFLGTPVEPDPVKIDGYRVQLFFDQNRDKALSEKARFMAMNPDIPAYVEWDAPNHYVRVGNLYTKHKAYQLVEEFKTAFPAATIYRSKIDLPKLED